MLKFLNTCINISKKHIIVNEQINANPGIGHEQVLSYFAGGEAT